MEIMLAMNELRLMMGERTWQCRRQRWDQRQLELRVQRVAF